MKAFDKFNGSDLLDIIYHTMLFAIVSMIILNIIYFIPARILKTVDESIEYTLIKGVAWVIVSLIVGRLFGVEYRKEEMLRHNEHDMSSNLLYMFLLMLITTVSYGFVSILGEYFIPIEVLNYLKSLPSPAIGDYDSVIGKVLFIIVLLIAAILNATGEELFIRYIAYKQLAKKNSGKTLDVKFIITTSLAFGLYHGIGLFGKLSKAAGLTRFLVAFIISVGIGLVFLRTKSIIYAIIMHTLVNFIPLSHSHLMVLSFYDKIAPNISDHSSMELVSLLTVYLILLLMTVLYRFIKKRFYRRGNR